MLLRHNIILIVCAFGAAAICGPAALASSPAPATASATRQTAPAAASALPDYGGRDSVGSAVASAGAATPLSPMGQAWRAFEALAIVLAMVAGGLYLLKRSGLLRTDAQASAKPVFTPKPALFNLSSLLKGAARQSPAPLPAPAMPDAPWVKILGSQPLAGSPGANLHLVSLGGKTLLIGTTPQSMSLLTELDAEWQPDTEDASEEDTEFGAYLSFATEANAPNETELLLSSTTMRLQAMIARSKTQAHGLHA